MIKGKPQKHSSLIGIYLLVSLVVFSILLLSWSYHSSIEAVNKEIATSFKQRHIISESIMEDQLGLIDLGLNEIRSNDSFLHRLIEGDQPGAQRALFKIIDNNVNYNFDILFVSLPRIPVWTDASSSLFDLELILPAIASDPQISQAGMIFRSMQEETDVTALVKAVPIIHKSSGKVLGRLFGGFVLNNNLSILEKIQSKTKSEAVAFFVDGTLIGSTHRLDALITKLLSRARFEVKPDITHSADGLIAFYSNMNFGGNKTALEVITAISDKPLIDLKHSYQIKTLIVFLLSLVYSFISTLMVKSLTYPSFKKLLTYSDKITSGIMDAHFTPGKIIELNRIGKSMEAMVHSLKTANEEIQLESLERKRTEDVLKVTDMQLRTLIRTIPDLVWLKDREGVYLFCNSKFERFFGAKESEIVGKTDYDFVDKDLADFFRKHDKAAMAKGLASMNEEEVAYADDGHHEILETIKTPVYDTEGELLGVLGIARDITERRQAEEERVKLEEQLRQSQKMEAIGLLAGGIAHDFNNILGVVIGNTELAIDDIPEWNPASINLHEIKTAAMKAAGIVKQLLSFSRKTIQELKPIEISTIIKDVLKLLRSTIPSTIEIKENIHTNDAIILADRIQINQIIMNLCINASHAMEETGGTLEIIVENVTLNKETIAFYPELEPGNYVKVTTIDTGPGIKPEIIERIFDPYFTTKDVGKGSGMGLSVVHGIVKNHKGAIFVDSEPGKGARFNVLFPAVTEKPEVETSIAIEIPLGTETILFVDDEKSVANVTGQMLGRLGYKVETSLDPLQALKLFKLAPDRFDLVITDMTMPQMTGAKLSEKLKEIRPDIPVIVCTGHSSQIDENKAFDIGIAAYVMKPIGKRDMATTIREVLDKRK